MVAGSAGTGKTTLSLQHLVNGINQIRRARDLSDVRAAAEPDLIGMQRTSAGISRS